MDQLDLDELRRFRASLVTILDLDPIGIARRIAETDDALRALEVGDQSARSGRDAPGATLTPERERLTAS